MCSIPPIVSVGECTLDHYPALGYRRLGGIAFNFAVQCRRAGAEEVSLVSGVGPDGAPEILDKLRQEGVGHSRVQVWPGATARQEIHLGAGGERIFPAGGYHPGVMDGLRLEAEDRRFILTHGAVACACFRQVEPLFEEVLALSGFAGQRVADFLDLGDYGGEVAILERCSDRLTVAFVSGDWALVERLRPLARASSCLLVVTLGAGGSVALVRGEPLHQPALPVPLVVDTTGCGDAFQAAFVVSYLQTADAALSLRHGAELAARVAGHLGAID